MVAKADIVIRNFGLLTAARCIAGAEPIDLPIKMISSSRMDPLN